MTDGRGISCKIALRWMPLDLNDDKSTLVQVMAWCRQATSHYLSQCWPTFMSPYSVTRPQWFNMETLIRHGKVAVVMNPGIESCQYDWSRRVGDWARGSWILQSSVCDTIRVYQLFVYIIRNTWPMRWYTAWLNLTMFGCWWNHCLV